MGGRTIFYYLLSFFQKPFQHKEKILALQSINLKLCLWVCILFPLPASADTEIPMIFVFLPPMTFLLIPFIMIKAFVLKRRLDLSTGAAYYFSTIGGLFSTLAGLPFIWFDSWMVVLGISSAVKASPFSANVWERLTASLLEAPWLSSTNIQLSYYHSGIILMLMIFFITSWLGEALIMYVIARKYYTFGEFSRASWRANLICYILLLAIIPFFYTFAQQYVYVPQPILDLVAEYKAIPMKLVNAMIEGIFKLLKIFL